MTDDKLVPTGTFTDDHDVTRCVWCRSTSAYQHYHDHEWGFPVNDDRRLFEKVCLEGFQAGATVARLHPPSTTPSEPKRCAASLVRWQPTFGNLNRSQPPGQSG